jgi:phenylpropionate dioxygenase-like ring-hydroxylating dioxygenase large terminal subunit
MFLKNAWYAAAWDHEITRQLRSIKILGERVVLYRTESGNPVALEDACRHRKLPLSMGRLKGDEVECGYHGLVYNPQGTCTHIPGAKRVPPSVCVRSYPTVSRYGLVWLWMGDASNASPNTIISVDHWDNPAWGKNDGGDMTVECNYLYVTDNLLDPSHVAWVHPTTFGNNDCEGEQVDTIVASDGVTAARWLRDVEVAPFYAPLVAFEGRCDRLQHYEVRFPSQAIIRAVFVPAGSSGQEGAGHKQALLMDSYNFITPIDADNTRYFWFQMRNFSPHDARVSKMMDEDVRHAFAEDQVILAAVHWGLANQVTPNVDLAIDRAPLEFRRALNRLIEAEGQPQGEAFL